MGMIFKKERITSSLFMENADQRCNDKYKGFLEKKLCKYFK